jgi:hypothetical protein
MNGLQRSILGSCLFRTDPSNRGGTFAGKECARLDEAASPARRVFESTRTERMTAHSMFIPAAAYTEAMLFECRCHDSRLGEDGRGSC